MRNMRDDKIAFGRLLVLCWLVYGFAAMPQGAVSSIFAVLVFSIPALFSVIAIVIKYRNPTLSSPNIYVELSYYLIVFVLTFSVLYWNSGTQGNYNIQLTHLDAAYFMIGTLSTAGTGNIVATSELARALQGVQMLFDLGFLLVAVTLVVTQFASSKSQPK